MWQRPVPRFPSPLAASRRQAPTGIDRRRAVDELKLTAGPAVCKAMYTSRKIAKTIAMTRLVDPDEVPGANDRTNAAGQEQGTKKPAHLSRGGPMDPQQPCIREKRRGRR